MSYVVTSFYKFHCQTEVDTKKRQEALFKQGETDAISGLIITGVEGINGTIAGSASAIESLKTTLNTWYGELEYKDSTAEDNPFKRWFVKMRDEIVTLGDTNICPQEDRHRHLTPKEWNEVLESDEDVVILDTRNDYETEIGVFTNATDPKLKQFSDFPKYVEECDIPKDKKVLMYCTGGIRCEKAILEMERQGYENVYQLGGGILKYMEECPNAHFKGECFVFDHRTAVNQELKPSEKYGLCPLSGDPADKHIICKRCQAPMRIHKKVEEAGRHFCSKNCEYQFGLQEKKRQKATV